jgi:uncharacterized membrane protein
LAVAASDDPSHSTNPGHTHSHSHGHSHGSIGWSAFRTNPVLQGVLGLVVVAAIATLVAILLLWPTDEGRQNAVEQGEQVGLGSDRYAGTVTSVTEGPCSYSTSARPQECRRVGFIVEEGPFAGESFEFQEFNLSVDAITPDVVVGDAVIAGYEPSTDFWFYADRDRRGPLIVLALLFAVVVIALGRLRGLAALAGMAVTLAVLVIFVARSVLDGNDPLLVSVVAASAIAFVSLYLTHGLNPTTTVALAGTLVSLVMTLALASVFFAVARFTGLASEEALLLPFIAGDIDLSSLLLGGAVLGTLGALDDVTVTQVATVAELHHRSPELTVRELVASGIRVGRDHIASTVNTLLLAYAGASMPLLLLFAASDQSLDKVANSELISVEIVRTLCGSVGLVAAVPITTVLAALVTERINDASDEDAIDDPLSVELADLVAPPMAQLEPEPAPSDADPDDEPAPEPSWDDFSPEDDERW